MTDSIIVALIAAAAAIIGQLIISKRSAVDLYSKLDKRSELTDQRLDAKLEKYQAVTDQRLDTLTQEVRKHNAFAERIPVVETKIAELERKIS